MRSLSCTPRTRSGRRSGKKQDLGPFSGSFSGVLSGGSFLGALLVLGLFLALGLDGFDSESAIENVGPTKISFFSIRFCNRVPLNYKYGMTFIYYNYSS